MMIRRLLSVLAAVLLLLPSASRADVAATGTFDVTVTGLPPSVSFLGSITFDVGPFTALGAPVDLASDVGPMTYSGTATVTEEPPSATFSFDATDTDFMFSGAGAGGCDSPNCLGGTATFNGRFTALTDPSGYLPAGVYTFDGSAAINFLGMGPGGRFGLNAFPALPTGTGSDVSVMTGPTEFFNSRTEAMSTFDAEAIFTTVTSGGETSFVGLTSVPGSPPAGIALVDGVSVFVDVETTAGHGGPVTICLANGDGDMDGMVDGQGIAVERLRLLHAATHPFVDVTTTAPPPGWVCGEVGSLSPFVLGVTEDAGSTTTTTLGPGGPTTTTTLPPCASVPECAERALGGSPCPGEEVNSKLERLFAKKIAKAAALFAKAAATEKAKRAFRLVKKANKQLAKVEKKAAKFVTKRKGPITQPCADLITGLVGEVRRAIEESGVGADPGAGGGGTRLRATISGRPAFEAPAVYSDIGPLAVQACMSSGSDGVCARSITLIFPKATLGRDIIQTAANVPFITYDETVPGSSDALQWQSVQGAMVRLTEGAIGSRLKGRFTGNAVPQGATGGGLVEIGGTFTADPGTL